LVSHLHTNNYLLKSTAGSHKVRLLVKPLEQILEVRDTTLRSRQKLEEQQVSAANICA